MDLEVEQKEHELFMAKRRVNWLLYAPERN